MKTATPRPPAKSKRVIRLKAKRPVAPVSLIRPWARKSALSLINALSSWPVLKLPAAVGAQRAAKALTREWWARSGRMTNPEPLRPR